jgi:hypothetical protein
MRTLIIVLCALLLMTAAAAQPAPPAWTITSTPRAVQAGDTLAVTVALPPGAAGVDVTIPVGLHLRSVETSGGVFLANHWAVTQTTAPSVLLMLLDVAPVAMTVDDVTVLATWNGQTQSTIQELWAPGSLHPSSICILFPIVRGP